LRPSEPQEAGKYFIKQKGGQPLQGASAPSHPVGQRADRQVDALLAEKLAVHAMQRHLLLELTYEQHCDHIVGRHPVWHDCRRCWHDSIPERAILLGLWIANDC